MRKYNAALIYQQHGDDGIIEVVEAEGLRSLHFGSLSKQSCMALKTPDTLQLAYCRAMMSWQLFLDTYAQALLIGLGGGSLAKYLLRHFPRGTVDVVEARHSVVAIAQRYFMLPQDPQLTIHIGDGAVFVGEAAHAESKSYDLIMIDAFDHDAMSTSVNHPAFFDACRRLLSANGILVINLWGAGNPGFAQSLSYLGQSFDAKVVLLPVNGKDNIIALGLAAGVLKPSLKALRHKAALMQQGTQIEFPQFVKAMKNFNPAAFEGLW